MSSTLTPHIAAESWSAVHEGGTKFYQIVKIFVVKGVTKRMVASITHWGPKQLFVAPFNITLGQSKVLTSEFETQNKQDEKVKGGYTKSVKRESSQIGTSRAKLRSFVTTITAEGKTRKELLDLINAGLAELPEDAASVPFVAPVEEKVDMSGIESWGSW